MAHGMRHLLLLLLTCLILTMQESCHDPCLYSCMYSHHYLFQPGPLGNSHRQVRLSPSWVQWPRLHGSAAADVHTTAPARSPLLLPLMPSPK